MKTLTATEAARRFADLLDSIERDGESYLITRRGRPVARVAPIEFGTGRALKEILRKHRPDPAWAKELRELRALLRVDESHWPD
ncbi:MAG: type II toxin-antitoxin system Phd/YefM family antitoxin [Chloroflexi bacterium]|nr:type II toxin-antitoxin system Phd/YefM family antitoxin [Chloroflexota bacterium]